MKCKYLKKLLPKVDNNGFEACLAAVGKVNDLLATSNCELYSGSICSLFLLVTVREDQEFFFLSFDIFIVKIEQLRNDQKIKTDKYEQQK